MRISLERKSSERVPSGEKRKKDDREVSEAGIVKESAIRMVDFALQAERRENLDPKEAIFQACLVRFRPIMMTSFAAMLGGLPLAFSFGEGSELRRRSGTDDRKISALTEALRTGLVQSLRSTYAKGISTLV